MDNKSPFLIRNSVLLGIFKTIYLFLLNHDFSQSAQTFKNECGLYDGNLESVLSKSLILRKCRCSKNQANQTDHKARGKANDEWLEGTFEGGPFQVRDEETHIFYVCDHCEQVIEKSTRRQDNEPIENEANKDPEHSTPASDFIKLKQKFGELQGEHQKLIAVTSELTTALQLNIIGQTKNIYSVLEQCKSIYPTLFVGDEPRASVLDNVQKDDQHLSEYLDSKKGAVNLDDDTQGTRTEKMQTQDKTGTPRPDPNLELLNLESLSPRSPIKSPLTPETVRQVLENVFEKIFEIEKSKLKEDDCNAATVLKKDDVEKIVNDVMQDLVKTPSNFYGAGEGEVSRPGSLIESVVMRNSEQFFDIDYGKLKRDLVHGENEKKIRLLQALRWRITKNDVSIRERVLESYVTNDVLDLCSPESLPEKILIRCGTDHYVQEATCRLINTLASLRQGRDYLTLDEKLLKRVLMKKIKDIKSVTSAVIRNMLVASVQKLSIRKQCRTQMVQEGLFEIMVDYLDEFYDKLSRYCLEYCSALLMNLCLVDEAKERSTKNPRKIVGLIRRFLEGDNECCLPYVNGVMFSLLEKEEVVGEAKNQNLDKLLIRLIRVTNNENIRKQLDFIVQSRLLGKGDANVSDTDEENREEVDLLEIELDQDDFITPLPSGEKLLEEYKADKSPNCISFSTMNREPPNSAKTFCEETKQFYHKPSVERGVFDSTKPRRYNTTCSQSLIKSYVKNKRHNQSCGRYPATPLCYMENCQRLQEGGAAQCSCSKCVPGQSRYSCGCYDAICREIDENGSENYATYGDFGKIDAKNSQRPLSTNMDKSEVKNDRSMIKSVKAEEIDDKDESTAQNETAFRTANGGRSKSGCEVCGEKKCECAFDSKPKLPRTPTTKN